MPIEDAAVVGSATTVTRNGLGARGIDFISTTTSSGTTIAYPIYDGHGNMVATLAKNGTGYNLNNRRSFGAWGEIRQGATTGEPKGRYCANLGHLDDDESGLTYMRARYCESASGRFLSEDPSKDGFNWFVMAKNSPQTQVDPSGRVSVELARVLWFFALCALGYEANDFRKGGASNLSGGRSLLHAANNTAMGYLIKMVDEAFWHAAETAWTEMSTAWAKGGVAAIAIITCSLYSLCMLGAMLAFDEQIDLFFQ